MSRRNICGLFCNTLGCLTHICGLYNKHYARVKGSIFPSFTSTSGVRHGCPLSPLLFAVIADVLLKRLGEEFPDCVTKAFADDTCLITPSFARDADKIMGIFKEFSKISNLTFNISKTVVIPLWESSVSVVQQWLQDSFPAWSSVEVTWASRYLGSLVGPGRGTGSCVKACTKFQHRIQTWSSLILGLHFISKVYETFCTSTLAFFFIGRYYRICFASRGCGTTQDGSWAGKFDWSRRVETFAPSLLASICIRKLFAHGPGLKAWDTAVRK